MDNPFYISELFLLICDELSQKEMIKLELLSKFHYNCITCTVWPSIIVGYRSEFLIRKYKFESITLNTRINSESLVYQRNNLKHFNANSLQIGDTLSLYLDQCQTIELIRTNINNESLKYFINCKELYIGYNENITDEGLQYISEYCKKLIMLDIRGTNITDNGVFLMSHLECLLLNDNKQITDISVKSLVNCKSLGLSKTSISDESVKQLINCYYLNISRTKITNDGVMSFIKCKILTCGFTRITDDCKEYLKSRGTQILWT